MTDPKEAKARQDRELIEVLDRVMSGLWNAGVDMDAVADDCKLQRGESLFDRIGKCEKAVVEWERELNALQKDLPELKKLLDAYPQKYANEASGLGKTSYDIAVRQHDSMRIELKKAREQLNKYKDTIRKVKT